MSLSFRVRSWLFRFASGHLPSMRPTTRPFLEELEARRLLSGLNVTIQGALHTIYEGQPLALTGNATGGNGHYTYSWDFGDPADPNNTASGKSVSHTYDSNGDSTYTVTLSVTDTAGDSGSQTAAVKVNVVAPMVANPGGPYFGTVGKAVKFTFPTVTTAADLNEPLIYYWDFGDGSGGYYQTPPTHVYRSAGTYNVWVGVFEQDESGNPDPNVWGAAYATVTVRNPGGTTYYVDAVKGNDANNGTSPSTAWQSIAQVENYGETVGFMPGDTIAFKGGQSFSAAPTNGAALYFAPSFFPNGTPTAALPFTLTSYGSGQATINSGGNVDIEFADLGGIQLHNLNVAGDNSSTESDGILFSNDLTGGVQLSYVSIDHVAESCASAWDGIHFTVTNDATSGYQNASITNSDVSGSLYDAIVFESAGPYSWNSYIASFQNIYVGHVVIHDNPGISESYPTGFGISINHTNTAVIERCEAYNNDTQGINADDDSVAFIATGSQYVTFQYDEAYNNGSVAANVGDVGFDLDAGVSNSVIQYCYSHNNTGPGYFFYASTADTLRYSVSENDSRLNYYGSFGGIGSYAAAETIYNNTVFISPDSNGQLPAAVTFLDTVPGEYAYNNLFVTTGGCPAVNVPGPASQELFAGNDYFASGWTPTPSAPLFWWGGSAYTALAPNSYDAGWRSTGQETYVNPSNGKTVNSGYQWNPQLVAAGQGGTIGNADLLTTLAAYRLKSNSPLIGRGLNLWLDFGVWSTGSDFYGNALHIDQNGYPIAPYAIGANLVA